MKKFLQPGLIIILTVVLITVSCVKKNFDFDRISQDYEWSPNMAVPGIKANLTIRDILQDYDTMELFIEDETGFLFLMYHKHIFSAKAKEMIIIPYQNFANELFLGPEFISLGFNQTQTTTMVQHNISPVFAFNSTMDIDSIIIKSADLRIAVTSEYLHTGQLVVTFPTIKKNGTPYSKTIDINTSTGNFSHSEFYSDIAGYTMDLSTAGTNELPIEQTLTLYDSGDTILPSNQAVVSIAFSNIYFQRMFGYIGQETLSYLDTIHLEVFNNVFDGTAYFEDPHFNVFINNSFGVPISMDFTDLTSFSTSTNSTQTFAFSTNPLYDPLQVNSPTLSQIGQTIATDFVLDKTNSQVAAIIDQTPKYLYFGFDAITNPLGYTGSQNFITEDSQIDMDLEIELPMWGNASFFALQDTTELDMEAIYGDLDIIEYLKLRINVDNGMPGEVEFQVYFTDSNYVVQDSTFTPLTKQVVPSGVLDGNGKVVQSTYKRTELLFDRSKIDKLKNVKYVLFRAYVYTTNHATELVKFYSDYNIDIRVSMQAQFLFED
ncbi:MAG: hypothetical protein ABIJ97_06380 [Bacteroidota bacterium]